MKVYTHMALKTPVTATEMAVIREKVVAEAVKALQPLFADMPSMSAKRLRTIVRKAYMEGRLFK